jgi:hypothetical protein
MALPLHHWLSYLHSGCIQMTFKLILAALVVIGGVFLALSLFVDMGDQDE